MKSAAVFLLTALLAVLTQPAAALEMHHDLAVVLQPESHKLTGSDVIEVTVNTSAAVYFRLSDEATIKRLSVNGKEHPFEFSEGLLKIIPDRNNSRKTVIAIDYEAIFDDSFPRRPVNTENPGYGVTGIISSEGCFLLGGAGWSGRSLANIEKICPQFDHVRFFFLL